jgi:hypothetical protein
MNRPPTGDLGRLSETSRLAPPHVPLRLLADATQAEALDTAHLTATQLPRPRRSLLAIQPQVPLTQSWVIYRCSVEVLGLPCQVARQSIPLADSHRI